MSCLGDRLPRQQMRRRLTLYVLIITDVVLQSEVGSSVVVSSGWVNAHPPTLCHMVVILSIQEIASLVLKLRRFVQPVGGGGGRSENMLVRGRYSKIENSEK